MATYDEPFLKCAAYILGEWGHTLAGSSGTSSSTLFALLLPLMGGASPAAKALMLTAAAKLTLHAPADTQLRARVRKLFTQHQVCVCVCVRCDAMAIGWLALTPTGPNLSPNPNPNPNWPQPQPQP